MENTPQDIPQKRPRGRPKTQPLTKQEYEKQYRQNIIQNNPQIKNNVIGNDAQSCVESHKDHLKKRFLPFTISRCCLSRCQECEKQAEDNKLITLLKNIHSSKKVKRSSLLT